MNKLIFEWDIRKETENIKKHNVCFLDAKIAFYDPQRIIVIDEKHSKNEPRLFCIGKTDKGILTVRFIYRNNIIRIFGAGYWRKGNKIYEKNNQRQE